MWKQWRREEVKAGGGYFENGRKCEIFRKSEKILDKCSPEFRGFQMDFPQWRREELRAGRGVFPRVGERCGPKQQRLGVVKIGWA